MIKIEHLETAGWEAAIRGMRNPRNSHGDMDSLDCNNHVCRECPSFITNDDGTHKCKTPKWDYIIGPNDEFLMRKLIKRGRVHAKFRRMISVWADVTAPLYWGRIMIFTILTTLRTAKDD